MQEQGSQGQSQSQGQGGVPVKASPARKILNWGAAAVAAAVILGGMFFGEDRSSRKAEGRKTFDAQLAEMADTLSQSLPMMANATTRMDALVAAPNKTLIYSYTLLDVSVDDMDVGAFEREKRPAVQNGVKTTESLQLFRDHGVTFKYLYRDRDGKEITTFIIEPKDYEQ